MRAFSRNSKDLLLFLKGVFSMITRRKVPLIFLRKGKAKNRAALLTRGAEFGILFVEKNGMRKTMKQILNQTFDGERALYALRNAEVENCRFIGPADG